MARRGLGQLSKKELLEILIAREESDFRSTSYASANHARKPSLSTAEIVESSTPPPYRVLDTSPAAARP